MLKREHVRILVYKRTHIGDPDRKGRFGINTCMGAVRALEYDAVIGIGALTAEARLCGIDGRINWIGIGPKKDWSASAMEIDPRGPQVRFRKFKLWDDAGPLLHVVGPMLARRFYERNARFVIEGLSAAEQREAEAILGLIGKHRGAPTRLTAGRKPARGKGGCPPRKRC
jgi:hypothetical protein